ncbi:unnamed protein product [Schistocephalus solidus]|uniref:Transposase n=1 Tax=Schistocephalus solidus TaxID=70667 RepID=A0A183TFK9_SCHSO|nr:unnamed protein product [Schistocephalus solidus]
MDACSHNCLAFEHPGRFAEVDGHIINGGVAVAVLEEGPSDSETANNNGNTVSHTEDGAPPVKAARLDPVDAPGTTGVRYYPLDMANEEQRAILEAAYDRDCPDCNRRFADPQLRNLVLRLHAFRYSGSNWSFTAPLPAWATAIAREADELEGRDLSAVIEELLPLLPPSEPVSCLMWELAHWLTGRHTRLRAPHHDLVPITHTPGFTKSGDMDEPSPSDYQSTGQPLDTQNIRWAENVVWCKRQIGSLPSHEF